MYNPETAMSLSFRVFVLCRAWQVNNHESRITISSCASRRVHKSGDAACTVVHLTRRLAAVSEKEVGRRILTISYACLWQ